MGQTFLYKMYSTAAKVHELHYFTWLGKEFHTDLSWWHVFIGNWNGISLMHYIQGSLEHNHTIQTDASGSWGCGAFFQRHWLQWKWPDQWTPLNIMAKEMAPMVLSCGVWGLI